MIIDLEQPPTGVLSAATMTCQGLPGHVRMSCPHQELTSNLIMILLVIWSEPLAYRPYCHSPDGCPIWLAGQGRRRLPSGSTGHA